MSRARFAPLRHVAAFAASGSLLLTLPAPEAAGQLSERHTLGGDAIAIHNLIGDVRVVPARGDRVEVAVLREGPDGADLRIEVGPWGEWEAVRIHYPDARLVDPDMGRLSRMEWRPDRNDPLGSLVPGSGTIRVSGSGRGVEAKAGITVQLPPGRRLSIHQALGSVELENVEGELDVRVRSARVRTRETRGSLHVEGRSGTVQVREAEGDLVVETRSGGITAERAAGGRVRLSARSGAVRASDITSDDASFTTRSGALRVEGARADRLRIESRSGSVRGEDLRVRGLQVESRSGRIGLHGISAGTLDVTGRSASVEIDVAEPFDRGRISTRSGRVLAYLPQSAGAELELRSSGRIEVDLPARAVERTRDRFTGVLGGGGSPLTIETRSGSILLRAR